MRSAGPSLPLLLLGCTPDRCLSADLLSALTEEAGCGNVAYTLWDPSWTQVLTLAAWVSPLEEGSSAVLDLGGTDAGALQVTIGEGLGSEYWDCRESSSGEAEIEATLFPLEGTVTVEVVSVVEDELTTCCGADLTFEGLVLQGCDGEPLAVEDATVRSGGPLSWSR